MGLTDRELALQSGGASGEVTITLIARKGRVTTILTSYQTVVSYTVAAIAQGFVGEVAFLTSDPVRTQFQLTIDGVVQFTDESFLTSWAIPFPENSRLDSNVVVLLEAQSIDGTQVTVDGVISGHERS